MGRKISDSSRFLFPSYQQQHTKTPDKHNIGLLGLFTTINKLYGNFSQLD
ncbi:MAG: hypothetical protein ACPGJS_05060 [Flammeovirgaceae bacterium]